MVHSKQVVQKTAEESASLIRFGDSFCITPCGSENCTGGIAECFIELICFGDNFFITPCGSENWYWWHCRMLWICFGDNFLIEPVLNWAKRLFAEHTSDSSTNYDSFLN